jgi:5-methylthioadenosine/S-adenosylhomocysteine deaminase
LDGLISSVDTPGSPQTEAKEVIDALGAPTFAGLVNSHLHSNELLLKGRAHGLPLEPYILRTWARLDDSQIPPPDVVYASTLLNCAEMLLAGTTGVVDDYTPVRFTDDYIDAVVDGYKDAGMRADLAITLMDLPLLDHFPGARRLVPSGYVEIAPFALGSAAEDLAFVRRQLGRWPSGGRVRCTTSASAPQRCTRATLVAVHELAREHDVPFHVHVQESRIQAMSGEQLYGTSMVRYMYDIGVLDARTTIAHAVWLDDEDVNLIAESGATVVHNPASNLKLGSGIAPIARLREKGVPLALGTDANTCNDSQNMLEAMKLAALLSCVASPDPSEWLSPGSALEMAGAPARVTSPYGGPRRLQKGEPADLVIMRRDALAFIPLNDPIAQLVYGASPADIASVVVGGRRVVDHGRLLTIDVARHAAVVEEAAARFWEAAQSSLSSNDQLGDLLWRLYARSTEERPGCATDYSTRHTASSSTTANRGSL